MCRLYKKVFTPRGRHFFPHRGTSCSGPPACNWRYMRDGKSKFSRSLWRFFRETFAKYSMEKSDYQGWCSQNLLQNIPPRAPCAWLPFHLGVRPNSQLQELFRSAESGSSNRVDLRRLSLAWSGAPQPLGPVRDQGHMQGICKCAQWGSRLRVRIWQFNCSYRGFRRLDQNWGGSNLTGGTTDVSLTQIKFYVNWGSFGSCLTVKSSCHVYFSVTICNSNM